MLQAALEARSTALSALLAGDAGAALGRIEAAARAVWTPASEDFVTSETHVLDLLGTRVAAAGREDWDRAYDGLSEWVAAVGAFQAGRTAEAHQALQRAAAVLGDA
jgi:hypothetical protein